MNKDKKIVNKNNILKFLRTSKFKTQTTTITDKMGTSAVLICYNHCKTCAKICNISNYCNWHKCTELCNSHNIT